MSIVKRILEARETYLYHLTESTRLASIRQHGLDPNFSKGYHSIYLSHDPIHAENYDNHLGDWTGSPVLLRVPTASLDPSKLGPDDVDLPEMIDQDDWREWSDFDWQESLELSGQCTYDGAIPPKVIEVRTNDGWVSLT